MNKHQRRPWTEADTAQLIELYNRGTRLKAIAAEMDRNYSHIRRRLSALYADGTLVPRGEARQDDWRVLCNFPASTKDAVDAIARERGVPANIVIRCLVRRGIESEAY
jgi:hypothetical protein